MSRVNIGTTGLCPWGSIFMRVNSGLFKSRIINYPKHIRPTADKVRKGLFDVLRAKIVDSHFLELFAGSGAVGIEALSNGANEVFFVEKDRRCCKIIEKNLSQLGLVPKEDDTYKNIFILAMDAFRIIDIFSRKNRKFDIIFLDPPYYKDLAKKTLQKLAACDILSPHALIVVEHSRKDCHDGSIFNLTSFKQKRYGDTVLSFYRKM